MKRLAAAVLTAVCLVLSMGSVSAKDDALEQDLAKLEKIYIPPLFFTSAANLPASVNSMRDYNAAWQAFNEKYYYYKPDYVNWQSYFDQISFAVQQAQNIVNQAAKTNNPAILPLAHEELEAVRMVMLDLRGKNGFPKFITDKLTIFHEPMEHIVLSVKGKTPAQIDDALLAELAETLKESWKAWETSEKCPVDQELWALTPAQMSAYYNFVLLERAALEKFEGALASGDKTAIIQTGVAVKPNFVECYKTFGNFAKYMAK